MHTTIDAAYVRFGSVKGAATTRSDWRGTNAFGLLGLMILVLCCFILTFLLMPKFGHGDARTSAAQIQIGSISNALNVLLKDTGSYPPGHEGLRSLLVAPTNVISWKGPYLKDGIPNDPWGSPYIYVFPGRQNSNGFDLTSAGPDGVFGTKDDLGTFSVKKRW
jgi:general secretion pathway protein G